jgi:four helix bundle protein
MSDALLRFMRTSAPYRKLETWQASMDFVERCYKATAAFPRDELFGLTSQIRRAAVSVPSNVAEGYCRRKTKVYLHHVRIALGSHGELETCIEIACRLGYLSNTTTAPLEEHLGSVGKLLYRLHESLEEKVRSEKKHPRIR